MTQFTETNEHENDKEYVLALILIHKCKHSLETYLFSFIISHVSMMSMTQLN